MPTSIEHPTTPDRRYFVVRGRLWRLSNPDLPEERRHELVASLMRAQRNVREALRSGNPEELAQARAAVREAKVALGERGPAWWDDGTPDLNRRLVRNTPYADWSAAHSDKDATPISQLGSTLDDDPS